MFSNAANAPARLIKDTAKNGIQTGLKAAYAEESFYVGADQLDALVSIKSKNEVIADIVALLQSPAECYLLCNLETPSMVFSRLW